MAIDIEFADGRVGAHADGGAASPSKPAGEAAKPRARGGSSGQGTLF